MQASSGKGLVYINDIVSSKYAYGLYVVELCHIECVHVNNNEMCGYYAIWLRNPNIRIVRGGELCVMKLPLMSLNFQSDKERKGCLKSS